MTARAFLIDIEGVLVADKRYQPVTGAVAWLNGLDSQGVRWCLVSNNTTHTPAQLVESLRQVGFEVTADRLTGALTTGLAWLRSAGHRRLGWLAAAGLHPWLEEQGFEIAGPQSDRCDAVVLGADPDLQVADLDQALRWLRGGADLLCLHRNRFWLDHHAQVRLGPGAWAAALEAAAPDVRSVTAGKPESAVYRQALEYLGANPAEALFISDDPFSDLAGARRLGLATVLVLSGKYPDREILTTLPDDEQPDLVLARADMLRRDMLP